MCGSLGASATGSRISIHLSTSARIYIYIICIQYYIFNILYNTYILSNRQGTGYESRNVVFIELSGSVISRVTRNSFTHYRYYIFNNIKTLEVLTFVYILFFYSITNDGFVIIVDIIIYNIILCVHRKHTHVTFCSRWNVCIYVHQILTKFQVQFSCVFRYTYHVELV